jgi:hypothetical protein
VGCCQIFEFKRVIGKILRNKDLVRGKTAGSELIGSGWGMLDRLGFQGADASGFWRDRSAVSGEEARFFP